MRINKLFLNSITTGHDRDNCVNKYYPYVESQLINDKELCEEFFNNFLFLIFDRTFGNHVVNILYNLHDTYLSKRVRDDIEFFVKEFPSMSLTERTTLINIWNALSNGRTVMLEDGDIWYE